MDRAENQYAHSFLNPSWDFFADFHRYSSDRIYKHMIKVERARKGKDGHMLYDSHTPFLSFFLFFLLFLPSGGE